MGRGGEEVKVPTLSLHRTQGQGWGTPGCEAVQFWKGQRIPLLRCAKGRNDKLFPGEDLALAGGGAAAEGIDVPELNVVGEIFYTDFAMHFAAGLAEPYDAELRLGALVLQIDDVAGLELSVDALQGGSAAADGAQAGGLHEGAGMKIDAPYFYGKLDGNALLTTTVHGAGLPHSLLRRW